MTTSPGSGWTAVLRDDDGRPRWGAWAVVIFTAALLLWASVWAALEAGEDRFWLLAFWQGAPPITFALWLFVPRRGVLVRVAVAALAAAIVFGVVYGLPRIFPGR